MIIKMFINYIVKAELQSVSITIIITFQRNNQAFWFLVLLFKAYSALHYLQKLINCTHNWKVMTVQLFAYFISENTDLNKILY
jgi:hypothetical protein